MHPIDFERLLGVVMEQSSWTAELKLSIIDELRKEIEINEKKT